MKDTIVKKPVPRTVQAAIKAAKYAEGCRDADDRAMIDDTNVEL